LYEFTMIGFVLPTVYYQMPWGTFCSGQIFQMLLDYAKRSFHRAANSIFGKIGKIGRIDY